MVIAPRRPPAQRLWDSLFAEGLRLMRERLTVYFIFAAGCAFAAWLAAPRVDFYDVLAAHPGALVRTPPVSVVLALALAALFFILPSALRRIDPSFRMTPLRTVVAIVTLASVGAITELGYALAVLPGIAAAVLLSQALVGALLRTRDGARANEIPSVFVGSLRGSVAMTQGHVASTLGVIAASLGIVLVPFALALLVLAIAGAAAPPSLVLTAPLLFLTFVYFECVRYALIVRWYRRLAGP
jgi:hypothetical protein